MIEALNINRLKEIVKTTLKSRTVSSAVLSAAALADIASPTPRPTNKSNMATFEVSIPQGRPLDDTQRGALRLGVSLALLGYYGLTVASTLNNRAHYNKREKRIADLSLLGMGVGVSAIEALVFTVPLP